MDQFVTPPQQEESAHLAAPLKALKISVFFAVIVIAGVYVSHQYRIMQQEKSVQIPQVQQETTWQEAIKSRNSAKCPVVADPFAAEAGINKDCAKAIEQLNALDATNAAISRAIQGKDEKLCSLVEKNFLDACIKAVRDAKSGVVKSLTNPLLGY